VSRVDVAVVGGSIGGLTAAVLLAELGYDVHVYERSRAELEARGAGIVVLPMTERYFLERGGDRNRVSLRLPWWTYVDDRGEEIASDRDDFRFGSWNGIYRALLDALPEGRYHLGAEMVGVEQADGGAVVRLADGGRFEADLVVCADGVDSTARRLLLPTARPSYAGYVAWRGTAEEVALSAATLELVSDAMVYQVLDRSHILVYAIPAADGSVTPGHRIQNFVWYRNYPGGAVYEAVMTDTEGRRRTASVPPSLVQEEHVAELHATTRELAPQLREIVLACPTPFVQAIFDLEVPTMVFGRICLLGDAAFSARPHVAAGTAKAAADAWALRDALQRHRGDVDAALAEWGPRQLELGRAVVARSRAMGIRSQVTGTMVPGDPGWKFGLFSPGN
jgi:2,6-dihydroxypyridine 3-monooxygenase